MSTMTFDAAGVTAFPETAPVKQPTVQPRAPRLTPMQDGPAMPAEAARARTFLGFGAGSALSFECSGWMRWTGA